MTFPPVDFYIRQWVLPLYPQCLALQGRRLPTKPVHLLDNYQQRDGSSSYRKHCARTLLKWFWGARERASGKRRSWDEPHSASLMWMK
jgi:hypothetical protein